jgi:hypothetical protein
MALTIGSHACYGLTLWLALRHWNNREPSGVAVGGGIAAVGLGLFLIAADFHRLEAATLPSSPPSSLGSDLHVTWDVPEPDRLAALWMLKRFVNTGARFHFVEPFQKLVYGVPFDLPEAEIRRAGSLAATEVLLERMRKPDDERLALLARMAHLTEVTPWMMPSDPQAGALAGTLRDAAAAHCGERLRATCLDNVFDVIDRWYAATHVE